MTRRFNLLLTALFCACLLPVFAQAQPQRGGEGGDRAQRGERGDRGQRGQRPNFEDMSEEERAAMTARFRERYQEAQAQRNQQLQESLGFSDDEFEVIQPLIAKVQQLTTERSMVSQAANAGGRGGFGGRGGAGGGGFMQAMQDEMSDSGKAFMQASTTLRETLGAEAPSTGDIQSALQSYRTTRDAMAAELDAAQAELQSVLTAKQEAQLVLQGLLD